MAAAGEALLWQAYDRLRCPTLVLRGAESDLLSPTTASAMTQRGPRAQLQEFAGVGHAPTLVQPDQRAVVRQFLLG
jgi:pimeloyl-ACP methyl ester carboxylesterase